MPGAGSQASPKPAVPFYEELRAKRAARRALKEKHRSAGPIKKRRAKKARAIRSAEKAVKDTVKQLDQRCRWPECEVPENTFWGRQEAAHWKAAGMGGDPLLLRTTLHTCLRICRWHHQGPRGLHSPFAKMKPVDPVLGTRGEVEFFTRARGGKWNYAGSTHPPRHQAKVETF